MDSSEVKIRKLRVLDMTSEVFSGSRGAAFRGAGGIIVRFILTVSTFVSSIPVSRRCIPWFLRIWPLVALNKQKEIIGYAWLNAVRQSYKGGYSTYLSISVMEGYQDTKIGTKLMEKLIEWSRECGVSKINLNVSPKDERALHFYRKLGFIKSTRDVKLKNYMRGEVYMAMELPLCGYEK